MSRRVDFDKVLRPYGKGENASEFLTSGNLFEIMVNKFHFPPDIVGKAIWRACYDISYNGLDFKSTKEASAGRQVRLHVKTLCAQMMKNRAKTEADKELEKACQKEITGSPATWTELVCFQQNCPKRTQEIKKSKHPGWSRFWLKPRGWWKI